MDRKKKFVQEEEIFRQGKVDDLFDAEVPEEIGYSYYEEE